MRNYRKVGNYLIALSAGIWFCLLGCYLVILFIKKTDMGRQASETGEGTGWALIYGASYGCLVAGFINTFAILHALYRYRTVLRQRRYSSVCGIFALVTAGVWLVILLPILWRVFAGMVMSEGTP